MFLDIVMPKDLTFPPESLTLPAEEASQGVGNVSSFLTNNSTTIIIAGLLVLVIAVIAVTKNVLKKELRNA